ncbi:Glycosyl transferase family 2 [Mariniphaga anaerophila]|uniref:Glycosyl transferase family 2 n=1 Tax=Mariniphaga anaerophila TaxID=1484053 RepID=A0A1M5AKV8_9BACT|nr:glycosyltransferase [Mariniphaga anaerophila]SHF30901.1 Glycosyl transferase family 2 [Mariniphaga anaerophila]
MFADKYLTKGAVPVLITEAPDENLGISVVIPCYREPDVLQTLNALYSCDLPESSTEVIILINHSEVASEETKIQNRNTKQELDRWISGHQKKGLMFFAVGPVELRKKWAGAGLARKKGMDEAIRRFNLSDRSGGIIVSLDADTLVEQNYLTEIERFFSENPLHVGATIAFSHQTEGVENRHLEGILFYEKYMAYYKMALEFTGYPWPMFTVGSAFAVTAGAYVKRGGMNRRQAGEDFYFLQNLAQFGRVGEIAGTTVHPSARLSDRVPFGTGPVLQKWMSGQEDLTKTYNFEAFADLKLFFDRKDRLFRISEKEFGTFKKELPDAVNAFITDDDFFADVSDLNANCSEISTFRKRFFQKFNAFKILKYLNFSHGEFYQKADLETQYLLLTKNFKK